MKRSKSLSAFVALVLLASSTGWAQSESPRQRDRQRRPPRPLAAAVAPVCTDQVKTDLVAAAEKRGIAVEADGMLTVAREGATFVAATIEGFENVPARALPAGVDFGFAYLDAPGSGIPTGYYMLRASAPEDSLRVGEFGGTVELVGEDGKVAAKVPAAINAQSLDVPNPLPYPRTIVGGSVRLPNPSSDRIIWISGWFHCPNGMWVCFDIIIFTRDFAA